MRRTMLLSILALTIGCEPQIDQSAQPLAVYPIPGLDRDRFPTRPIVASASDADCVTPCPSGSCWDVAMMHDPDQPLHQATCLR